jgi:hypothetical protein
MKELIKTSAYFILLFVISFLFSGCAGPKVTPVEARSIAKEAYIYGFPLIDNYRILHAYFVDTNNPEYKAPINVIKNMPKVYTPEDKAIQTPNSDTPYSMALLDLRSEPVVLIVPPIEKNRYFSVQLIDVYTANFDYLGSRTTGNEGGAYMIAGPGWKGEKPESVKKIINSETELVMAAYRTQLFHPEDLENVIKIQEGYKVLTLSEFLKTPAPKPAEKIDFIQPLTAEAQKTSPEVFNVLNFILRFCPVHPSEKELMTRFARIGIGADKEFNADNLSADLKEAISEGIKDAWKELEDFQKSELATGKVTSGDLFGTREYLKNNYLYRWAAVVLGIYGNSKQEAMYPIYLTDENGQPLDGTTNKYTLHFNAGQFPPVHAFWSVTMYELPSSLLVANPINRYLINSPMLPQLKLDKDGGLTIYIQNESPGKENESNWLPAPKSSFMAVLRVYWPKEEALNGTWKNPPMQLVKK